MRNTFHTNAVMLPSYMNLSNYKSVLHEHSKREVVIMALSKSSVVYQFFDTSQGDTYADCNLCNVPIKCRRNNNSLHTTCMLKHLRRKHPSYSHPLAISDKSVGISQKISAETSSPSEVDRNKVLSDFFNSRLTDSPEVSVGNGSSSFPKLHVPQNASMDPESSDSESGSESDDASELEENHDEIGTTCWKKRLLWMEKLSKLPIATQVKEVKVCDADFIIDMNRLINSIFKCKTLVVSNNDQAILKRHRNFLNNFISEADIKKKRVLLLEKVHDGFLGALLQILLSPPKSKIIQCLVDADDDDACMKVQSLSATYPACKRKKCSVKRKFDMEDSSSDSEEDTNEEYANSELTCRRRVRSIKRKHHADDGGRDSEEETSEDDIDSEEEDNSQESDDGASEEIDIDSDGETGDEDSEETDMNSEDEEWENRFLGGMHYPVIPKDKILWLRKFRLQPTARQCKIIKKGNLNLFFDIDKMLTAVLYGGILERPPQKEDHIRFIDFFKKSIQSLTRFLHDPSLRKRQSYLLQNIKYLKSSKNLLALIIHSALMLLEADELIAILTESWAVDSDVECP